MSKKIFVVKTSSGLSPADEEAREVVNKWKIGASYSLTYAPARNPKFHRMVFGVAQLVCDNAPEGTFWCGREAYAFIKWVELCSGFTEEQICPDGEIKLHPLSIAFENMDESEFKKLFDALITEAAQVLGVSEGELLEQLAEAA